MPDAILFSRVRDHTVEAILIYFLNTKASRDPYFAFVYLVQSVFFVIAQKPWRKLKCSQNVIKKNIKVVHYVFYGESDFDVIFPALRQLIAVL